jgi:copper resistance protein D
MSVDLVSVIIRALSFIAMFQAVGGVLFMAMFGDLLGPVVTRINKNTSISAWTAVVLTAVYQSLGAARLTGEYAGLGDWSMQALSFSTNVGVANEIRFLGVLVIAVVVARAGTGAAIASITAACVVVMSFVMTGHTASNPQRWLLAPLLFLHLWIVAFWFGSLWPLLQISSGEENQVAAAVIARFSSIATWLVPGIAVAGIGMALILLPGVSALLAPYGMLLLTKVAGFALLLGLAAFNKWRLVPAIESGAGGAMQSFRRSISLEIVLICGVLIVTAVMTGYFSPEP